MPLSRIRCFMLTPIGDSGRLWRAPDGAIYHLGNEVAEDGVPPAPVGAMWNADWLHGCRFGWDRALDRNADGLVLQVRTPGGDWLIDGPALRDGVPYGDGWTRTGTAPDITATPSIVLGRYHGWLKAGWLEEC